MKHSKLVYGLGSLLFISLIILIGYLYMTDISVNSNTKTNSPFDIQQPSKKDTLFFGVVSRYSPNLIYRRYQPIMDYLNNETPWHFEIKLSNSYSETIEQIVSDQVSFAFVGSYIYVNLRDKYPIEPILKPLNQNRKAFTHSVIITNKNSKLNSPSDLKNAKIALPSKHSFSGYWFLNYQIPQLKLDHEEIDSLHFFDFQHTVVYQILKGNFDTGAVKEVVAQEFLGNELKIIGQSPPFPGAPIIIKKGFNQDIVNTIVNAFTNSNFTEYMQQKFSAEESEFKFGFVKAFAKDYNEMAGFIKKSGEN